MLSLEQAFSERSLRASINKFLRKKLGIALPTLLRQKGWMLIKKVSCTGYIMKPIPRVEDPIKVTFNKKSHIRFYFEMSKQNQTTEVKECVVGIESPQFPYVRGHCLLKEVVTVIA